MAGVTGTNGKTTTAFLIHHLMKTAWHRAGLLGTILVDDGETAAPAQHTTPGSGRAGRVVRPHARQRLPRRGDGGFLARHPSEAGRRPSASTPACSPISPRITSTITARWKPTSGQGGLVPRARRRSARQEAGGGDQHRRRPRRRTRRVAGGQDAGDPLRLQRALRLPREQFPPEPARAWSSSSPPRARPSWCARR